VARGECLALQDREVDLDLVRPGGVHGQVRRLATRDARVAGKAGQLRAEPNSRRETKAGRLRSRP
jgi:hypothetical protein